MNSEKQQYIDAFSNVYDFYSELETKGSIEYRNLTKYNSTKRQNVRLTYRKPQEFFALSIMQALQCNDILLIEAGVGTGKSMGYLIPVFYTYQNVEKFDKIIISTSTMALQQQLLIDIDRISQMLGLKISVAVVKGIRNYACYKKIKDIIRTTKSKEETSQMIEILETIKNKHSADRADLMEISESAWEKIKATSRGICSNCPYARKCYYQINQNVANKSNIVITNHAFLSYMSNKKDPLITESDAIIIDEAHNLEEAIRSENEKSLSKEEILEIINKIYNTYEELESMIPWHKVITQINKVYQAIRENIKLASHHNSAYAYKEENQQIRIQYGALAKDAIRETASILEKLVRTADALRMANAIKSDKNIYELEKIYEVFNDMGRTIDKREGIYWTVFLNENDLIIKYTPKSVLKTMNTVYKLNKPFILVSGTMGGKSDNYSPVVDGLEIEEATGRTITREFPVESTYNYKENSIVYYDPTMPNPKVDSDNLTIFETEEERKKYIDRLAREVESLIRISFGKSLILFTSKKDMEDVFKKIKKFHRNAYAKKISLYIQEENNTEEIKRSFREDENSCLFATGSFWEGIDISGVTLSNVIVCRLPFPIVDPIRAAKELDYSEQERFKKVYINPMILKLEQAAGRPYRLEDDTAIFACLDPRFENYLDEIQKALPFPKENYTTNKEDLRKFARDKIFPKETKSSKKRK